MSRPGTQGFAASDSPLHQPYTARRAHDDARELELHAELEETANRRSGPGAYEPPLHDFTAQCGCSGRFREDCDGESVSDVWEWDDSGCHGAIVTYYDSTPALYAAYREENYCGCGECRCPIGHGRTQDEAIADLLEQEAVRS